MITNTTFRRINGRIVPINLDKKDPTRAARNIFQKGGTVAASTGGALLVTHSVAKNIELVSRKALVKARASKFTNRATMYNVLRKISKKIKRSKLGMAGIIVGSIGGFAITYGNKLRATQTRSLREEDNIL